MMLVSTHIPLTRCLELTMCIHVILCDFGCVSKVNTIEELAHNNLVGICDHRYDGAPYAHAP